MKIMYRQSIWDSYKEVTIQDFAKLNEIRFNFDNNSYKPVIQLTSIDTVNEILYYTDRGEIYD